MQDPKDNKEESFFCNTKIKVKYLCEEKNRIETELQQLRLNNQILRAVNSDLAMALTTTMQTTSSLATFS